MSISVKKAQMWFVKMLTGEFEIEPSSVNEASAQSFSHAHFQELFSNIMKTKNYTQEQHWAENEEH